MDYRGPQGKTWVEANQPGYKLVQEVKLASGNLNVAALVDRLQVVFHDTGLYKQLLEYRGSDAQKLLNVFQWVLDEPKLETGFRRALIVATQRLSTKSGLYPTCYELQDIVQEGQHPVSAGGFADIYKADLHGQTVCLKAIRMYQNTDVERFLKQFSKEAILWGQLSHPNVLPIYGLYRFQHRICLVSPWMESGDISTYLKSTPDAHRLPLAVDVARGLSYLHKNGIVHGDLKGPNVLVNAAGRACLADFGISSISDSQIPAWTSHSCAASKGGSVRWQAPELLDMENDEVVKNSTASDVYAWACVGYEIFTSDVPFAHILRDTVVMLQVKFGARPTRPPESSPCWREWGLTEAIWSLLQDCWKAAPAERPTIDQVISRLNPEVLQGGRSTENATAVLTPANFRQKINLPLDPTTLPEFDSFPRDDGGSKSEIHALIDSDVPSSDSSLPPPRTAADTTQRWSNAAMANWRPPADDDLSDSETASSFSVRAVHRGQTGTAQTHPAPVFWPHRPAPRRVRRPPPPVSPVRKWLRRIWPFSKRAPTRPVTKNARIASRQRRPPIRAARAQPPVSPVQRFLRRIWPFSKPPTIPKSSSARFRSTHSRAVRAEQPRPQTGRPSQTRTTTSSRAVYREPGIKRHRSMWR